MILTQNHRRENSSGHFATENHFTESPSMPDVSSAAALSSPVDPPKTLWNRGFIALLITQFLVAMNDNIFRWFIIPVGNACVGWDGEENRKLILMIGGATMFLPFLLFASPAGYCTDRFSRRRVMIVAKAVEIVAVLLGFVVIYMQSVPGMLAVLALLSTQSAFFSPSKYGSIPDLVPHDKLATANGLIAMSTMIAVIAGTVIGSQIGMLTTVLTETKEAIVGTGGTVRPWLWMGTLLGVAIVGFISSLFITRLDAVDPKARFPWNFPLQTCRDIRTLFSYRSLCIAALASAFFWGLAAIAQQNIDIYSKYILHVSDDFKSYLIAILSLGIGFGSIFAGLVSRRRIELGLVPIGAFGIAICAIILSFTPVSTAIGSSASMLSHGFLFAVVFMTLLGFFAGMYDIPMASYIQESSPKEIRGRILAAVNFFSFSFMFLFASLLFPILTIKHFVVPATIARHVMTTPSGAEISAKISSHAVSVLNNDDPISATLAGYTRPLIDNLEIPLIGMSANGVWLTMAIITLVIGVALVLHYFLPFASLFFSFLFTFVYRRKIVGLENVPTDGPVLFVGNHVGYLDGFIVYTALPRPVRFFAHSDYIPPGLGSYLADQAGVIRVLPGKRVIESLRTARQALKNGDQLCIFPEGGITRTGGIRHFEPGFLAFLKGNEDVPIVPFYIGGLFGSMFSYANGGKTTFWPKKLKESVVLAFGKPIDHPRDPQQVQQIIEELGVDTMREHTAKQLRIPQRLMIRNAKRKAFRRWMVDSTGISLSGYRFLTGVLIARKLLKRKILAPDERNVGALVPMSVGGMIVNAALAIDNRVVVNLNPTFGNDIINYCIHKANLSHVLTSRKLIARFPEMHLDAEVVCMEDLLPQASWFLKISTLLRVLLTPAWILERQLGLHRIRQDDDLTIIFTSGSTGKPKGVELTHGNIAHCARGFLDTVNLRRSDVTLGVLPFFHAFGYVGNFWLVMLSGCMGVLHYSPLDAKIIGEISRQHGCTFTPLTPTFLRQYLRRCPKEDFAAMQMILTGAEKLPLDLIEAWEKKFGMRPSEGYGTTELSPCASTNLPPARQLDTYHPYLRDGSIGQPLPHTAMKVVDLDTGEDLPTNEVGMIVVKGPIVMKGYCNDPEKTAEVIKDRWYWTGDVGRRDAEGFVFITGRQSRISKIAGEMVPHILIEEKIQQILAAARRNEEDVDGPVDVAVTALPHETRGERVIVLHRPLPLTPGEIRAAMLADEFPHLWIPAENCFREVSTIPVLGTGKLDLQAVKQLAEQLFDGDSST